jgi:hypothetical protein
MRTTVGEAPALAKSEVDRANLRPSSFAARFLRNDSAAEGARLIEVSP